jgi:hypothetical protein
MIEAKEFDIVPSPLLFADFWLDFD